MREIAVISGKGGTGKTSLTAAFAHLARGKVICDLDVDAPDLHILLDPRHEREEDFFSGHEAVIRAADCMSCGVCAQACRFGAVRESGGVFVVDPLRCEGCKVCVTMCPAQAVDFPERYCGKWYVSATRFGPMVHAQLFAGQENSGRLVTLLKQQAREMAKAKGLELILSDGAPGIGCPVISSLAGVNLAVVVTEPTPSGVHDLQRVGGLCEYFRLPVAVLVNKEDLNPAQAATIESLCRQHGYAFLGGLPYDPVVTEAMVQGRAVTEMADSEFTRAVGKAWGTITKLAGLGA